MGEVSNFKEWQLNKYRSEAINDLCKLQEDLTAQAMDNILLVFETMKPLYRDNLTKDKTHIIGEMLSILTWQSIAYMDCMADLCGLDKEAIWQSVQEMQEEEKKLLKGKQKNG
jgi:hypothetical protein